MERKERKYIRLINYDYSSNGLYFITICTKDRFHYLSEILCDDNNLDEILMKHQNYVGDGVLDVPHIKLTQFGNYVDAQINIMNNIYHDVKIIKSVIMPDHVHMIIYLFDNENIIMGKSRTPSPTNARIPAFISTFKRFVNKKAGYNIWQRSFHDHIIRSEKEFLEICEYIDNNPINWVNHIYNRNFWR